MKKCFGFSISRWTVKSDKCLRSHASSCVILTLVVVVQLMIIMQLDDVTNELES